MSRLNLMRTDLTDLIVWRDLATIVDEVWLPNFDTIRKQIPTLRDTYSYTDLVFNKDRERYYIELPRADANQLFKLNDINFNDDTLTILVLLKTRATPLNPAAMDTITAVLMPSHLSGTQSYNIKDEYSFTLGTPLLANQYIEVVGYRYCDFDGYDLIKYTPEPQVAEFTFDFPNVYELNIFNSIDNISGEPARINTGWPMQLISVFLQIADGTYQHVSPMNYEIIDTETIKFLILPYNPVDPNNPTQYLPTNIRVEVKQTAVEVGSKLAQLGFDYPNIEFATRPSAISNAHILQTLADNYANYIRYSKGTPQFLDFFQYASNSAFSIYKLWDVYDSSTEYYTDLRRKEFIPEGATYVSDIVNNSNADFEGAWYPTSHVSIFYDIFTYGSYVEYGEVEKFFDYVAPINLVLHSIVFGGRLTPSEKSTIFLGGACRLKFKYN